MGKIKGWPIEICTITGYLIVVMFGLVAAGFFLSFSCRKLGPGFSSSLMAGVIFIRSNEQRNSSCQMYRMQGE